MVVPGDGDGVGDTALESCQIGDHCVKDTGTEMLAHALQISLLV